MTRAILDSSTLIDIERASRQVYQPWAIYTLNNVAAYRVQSGLPFLSVISVVELTTGLLRVQPGRDLHDFKSVLSTAYRVVEIDEGTAILAARIISSLDRIGLKIGLADSLIAASAIQRELVLVTSNERHFARVSELGFPLRTTNWRTESPLADS